jgi:hypothetical protein
MAQRRGDKRDQMGHQKSPRSRKEKGGRGKNKKPQESGRRTVRDNGKETSKDSEPGKARSANLSRKCKFRGKPIAGVLIRNSGASLS